MSLAAYATLEPGLNAAFAAITGIPVGACGSRDGKARLADLKLDWEIISTKGVGRDELRFEYDPDLEIDGDEYAPPLGEVGDLGGFVETATGNRAIVLQVLIEGARPGQARECAELARNRLGLKQYRAAFSALGLAVAWVGPSIDVGKGAAGVDGRARPIFAFELECNASSAASATPVTTIETIGISATIES